MPGKDLKTYQSYLLQRLKTTWWQITNWKKAADIKRETTNDRNYQRIS